MKAITIHQPWASLIALGEKRFETRGWRTKHRGQIAIHAARRVDKEEFMNPVINAALQKHGILSVEDLPTGEVIAIADLVDCLAVGHLAWDCRALVGEKGTRYLQIVSNEYRFGWYDAGRYAWEMENVRQITPVEAKGQQGLWNWDENSKLKALNAVPFFDWSSGMGELEYVLAKKTDEHMKLLREAGFTESEIAEATDNDQTDIDLATLAFNYAGATNWSKDKGFFHWNDEGPEAGE